MASGYPARPALHDSMAHSVPVGEVLRDAMEFDELADARLQINKHSLVNYITSTGAFWYSIVD